MTNLPGGRNQAKKVYSYFRTPPQVAYYVISEVTKSFDKESLEYHRDYYYLINSAIEGIPVGSPISYGEYDEDLISFNWETSKTKTFNITFTSTPIVVLVAEPNQNLENINMFIDAVSSTNLTVQLSAPFSGSIYYRAVYNATYPVTVQRNVLSSSSTYELVAGYAVLSGEDYFTASYTSLGSTPTQGWFTPFDVNSNDDANVAVVASSSFGLTSTTGDISSGIVNRINFIFAK